MRLRSAGCWHGTRCAHTRTLSNCKAAIPLASCGCGNKKIWWFCSLMGWERGLGPGLQVELWVLVCSCIQIKSQKECGSLAPGLVTWPWGRGSCSGKCYLFPGPRMCVSVNVRSKGTVLAPGTWTVQRIVPVCRQITNLCLHSFFLVPACSPPSLSSATSARNSLVCIPGSLFLSVSVLYLPWKALKCFCCCS